MFLFAHQKLLAEFNFSTVIVRISPGICFSRSLYLVVANLALLYRFLTSKILSFSYEYRGSFLYWKYRSCLPVIYAWIVQVLALVGDQLDYGDNICGAVLSIRFNEDILSVWNRNASDHQVSNFKVTIILIFCVICAIMLTLIHFPLGCNGSKRCDQTTLEASPWVCYGIQASRCFPPRQLIL